MSALKWKKLWPMIQTLLKQPNLRYLVHAIGGELSMTGEEMGNETASSITTPLLFHRTNFSSVLQFASLPWWWACQRTVYEITGGQFQGLDGAYGHARTWIDIVQFSTATNKSFHVTCRVPLLSSLPQGENIVLLLFLHSASQIVSILFLLVLWVRRRKWFSVLYVIVNNWSGLPTKLVTCGHVGCFAWKYYF